MNWTFRMLCLCDGKLCKLVWDSVSHVQCLQGARDKWRFRYCELQKPGIDLLPTQWQINSCHYQWCLLKYYTKYAKVLQSGRLSKHIQTYIFRWFGSIEIQRAKSLNEIQFLSLLKRTISFKALTCLPLFVDNVHGQNSWCSNWKLAKYRHSTIINRQNKDRKSQSPTAWSFF